LVSLLLILAAGACLDRIDIDIGENVALNTVVINGHITNDPGPYRVNINIAFDLESKEGYRNPLSAKRVTMSDNTGATEQLTEVSKGVYETATNGIRGKVGRIYSLRVELADGRVFESKPDTLMAPGRIDSVYAVWVKSTTPLEVTTYGFDIMFNPSVTTEGSYHILWKFTGTFQANTNPEGGIHEPCGEITCAGCNMCNFKPLCSGIRNMSSFPGIDRAIFVRVAPCECCTCWYKFFNPEPLISDDQLVKHGKFSTQKAGYIPLDPWIFQHKVHANVSQFSLSRQAFNFWRGVKDQKTAINSLFQPVTGKIKGNWVQVGGPEGGVEGLFFAAGVANKAIFIERTDVPGGVIIPDALPFPDSCLKLFPYATTKKPNFWD